MPRDRFFTMLASSDVILDPIHFGGGNSSYEALAVGAPIVTLPGDLLRSRITQALYSKAGYRELVAESEGDYIEKAVRLGTDPDYRERARAAIAAGCDVLYDDDREVRDLEDCLERLSQEL